MTENDRVFDAFRNCITEPKCRDCPWTECDTLKNRVVEIPIDLALAVMRMLKAQEPRVMTLEEVRCAYEEPMWFESKGTFRGQKGFWVLSKGVSTSFVIRLIPAIGNDDTQLSLAAYGKVWRCWTSQPTAEQREATSWND